MSNIVYNRIEMKGIDKKHIYTDGELDFNKIIPQPLNESGCEKKYLLSDESPILPNKEKPWFNWYAWNINHWGTKWPAYDTEKSEDEVEFYTANSAISDALLIALSVKYPNTKIMYEWEDVDAGEMGTQTFYNGNEI